MSDFTTTRSAKGKSKKVFTLTLKDGVEVRTLEELRNNFDLEKIVEYFKNGELLSWLEDRFYDDEAEAIENIDADDRNLTAKICVALDVECDVDLDFMHRLREKKSILAEMTDDDAIIDNAAATALDQGDLGELINMDYKTIYLCGENFNVPIRVANMKYIGVLSTPKIKIRAQSQDDLDAQNISFENCKLPWTKESPIEPMKALASRIFESNGEWPIIDANNNVVSTYNQLNKAEKAIAIDMCCHGNYKESEIVFMMFRDDISDGFAFTIDSFCTGGASEGHIFKYNEIKEVVGGLIGGYAFQVFER